MVTQLGLADSYMLFGKNGVMQRNKRVHIHKGTKVLAVGYAGVEQWFVVYDEDMNAVEICNGDPADIDEGDLDRYFSALHKVGEETQPISEKFGIGFYYDESDEIVSDEIIEKSLQRAKNLAQLKKDKEEREQREWNEAKERLAKEYNYLERAADRYDHKVVGKNLRTELKRNFPGVKFSVRKESYDCYRIEWTDGPTDEQVSEITNRYKTGRFDAYTDYHYSEHSPFTSLFGGVDYVFTSRGASDKVLAEHPDDWRKIDFSPKVEKPTAAEVVTGEFKIIDYSEKAIALVGDTRSIKDQLKKLGGRFNPRLSCGAGWIFSAKKRAELESLVMA